MYDIKSCWIAAYDTVLGRTLCPSGPGLERLRADPCMVNDPTMPVCMLDDTVWRISSLMSSVLQAMIPK